MLQNAPARITAIYALIGVLWILLTDRLLQLLINDPVLFARLGLLKGCAFIAVTAMVFYRLIARDHEELRRARETVLEREEHLRNVLETLPVGVWLIDREGNIAYGNPTGREIWGGVRFVGVEKFTEYKGWWLETGKRIEAEEWGGARAIRQGEASLNEEIEIEAFDGSRKIIRHSAVPLRNGRQEIIGAVVVNEDITLRRRMEEELRSSENIYRELFDNNPQPMWVFDKETLEFLAVNDAAVEHYGYSRSEFLRMTIRDIRPAGSVPALLEVLGKPHGKLRKAGVWQHMKKDATLIDVEITTHDLMFNGQPAGLVLARDVTESRRAEREITVYQEELRFMASEMSLIEERERRQIASALHDQIGQTLALARMRLGALQKADTLEMCNLEAAEIRGFLEEAIRATRTLTSELSPPILYELGFEAAVQSLCDTFQKEHGISCRFTDDQEPKPINDDIRTVLFQAVRELLMNVIKHARALTVQLSCRRAGDTIRVTVEDDGIGFDNTGGGVQKVGSHSFGLFSIRERLKYLGGRSEVESAPGQGTRITLTAPLTATPGDREEG